MTILALDPKRTNNAQAIRDAHLLGYINDDDAIIDVTYNTGKFWKLWFPSNPDPSMFIANDLDPRHGTHHDDWRKLRFPEGRFDVVVFDPDYKLQGTSSNQGPASSNAAYGMDREYRPVQSQLDLITEGMIEAIRVCKAGGRMLFKTMDQVVSGHKEWLTKQAWLMMEGQNVDLVDEIHVFGHRAQPKDRVCKMCGGAGRLGPATGAAQRDYGRVCPACTDGRIPIRQVHTHGSFSTLMIFAKGKS